MTVHGHPVDIGATKVRGLLGVLAFKRDEPVPADYLADALWDEDRPPDPAKTLQTYVSRLRRAINDAGAPAEVTTDHGAYRLEIGSSTVDYRRFATLVRAGHRAVGEGDHATAADSFAAAVDLWHGRPFADLRTAWASRMQESLVARDLLPAENALAEARLALGDHEFVLDRLRSLLADHPHDYRMAELWMRALAEAGRSGEIPAFFREFTHRLDVDLGVAPSQELTEIYQSYLQPRVDVPVQRGFRVPAPPRAGRHFTGRADLLAQLDRLLLDQEKAAVVALDGRPGVGKTAVVRHWAEHRRDRFPDGMLHMDLSGYGGQTPVEPGTAAGMFLSQLAVPANQIPDGLDERVTLLRLTVAGRRLLVIFDNARDSTHVRALLPAMTDCPVVITSRRRLTGVAVRDGAERLTVPELGEDEAVALLEALIGPRAAQERATVRELAALCERLPLAIRIVGEHVASRPGVPLGDLVDELRQARRLLDAGAQDDDATLRSAFTWSYRALSPRHGQMFRLLGLFPTPRFDAAAVAAVSGLDRADVESSLDALVGAHLVEQERAGRYRVHDLLHAYAADTVRQDEPPAHREQASRRLAAWYTETARTARRLLTADPNDVPPLPESEPLPAMTFDSRDDAKAWFDQERGSIVALVRAGLEDPEVTWRLAACLTVVHDHDLHELLEVHELGRAAAALAGQPAAEAGGLTCMGVLCLRLDDNTRASEYFRRAHGLFEMVGDNLGQAVSLHNIGCAELRLGQPANAIGYHQRALDAFTAMDNDWAVANVLRWLGDDHTSLGRHHEAYDRYQTSFSISRRLGDDPGMGATLNRLAQLELELGRPDRAVEAGLSGLDIHQRTGDQGSAADVLCTLAAARIELGDYAQAVGDAAEAVHAHEQLRNDAGRATALEVLTRAHAAADAHDLTIEA
jgi:DNA-binding SARP family transcriptional activator/tetratricopeptide (TPR) repeat protein